MDDLGTVLALLHEGPSRVSRLRAEIVTRVDPERARAAWENRARSEDGAMVIAYAEDEDEGEQPGPAEEVARVWVDLESRCERAERNGTREELGVRRGDTWWRWDPHNGAISNQAEKASTTIVEELPWLLGGISLISVLRIEAISRASVAGREVWRCRAIPREGEDDRFMLHRLPAFGAQEYELDVDADSGLVLRIAGRFESEVFTESEVVELGVDEDLDEDLFTFESPDGSPVRSIDEMHGPHHMHVTPRRLLELAGFALFAPRRVPEKWHATLSFAGSIAMIGLHAHDGLRSVQINQVAADEDGDDPGWDHANAAPWQVDTHDGIDYEWRDPNEDWQPARVRFVRDGTRVLIDSASLSAAELLELARTMVPLRDDAPDFSGG